MVNFIFTQAAEQSLHIAVPEVGTSHVVTIGRFWTLNKISMPVIIAASVKSLGLGLPSPLTGGKGFALFSHKTDVCGQRDSSLLTNSQSKRRASVD